MTMASVTPPPQALFRELADLGNLIFSMLAGAQVTVRRWPAYYMVYLEVDRLCREINGMAGYLARGFVESDGSADAARIMLANTCLARIDGHARAIVDLLARIEFHRLVDHGNPALKTIIDSHFSPKSPWYRAFQTQYCAGRVSVDGRVLERTVLTIDPYSQLAETDSKAGNFAERQTFDLASTQSRSLHGRMARQVLATLNQVYAALGDFFVTHCPSVRELLHPCMT
jgi:hypothetical protein